MYKVGIITASDKGSIGQRKDLSGPAIESIVSKHKNFKVEKYIMVQDDKEIIKQAMIDYDVKIKPTLKK